MTLAEIKAAAEAAARVNTPGPGIVGSVSRLELARHCLWLIERVEELAEALRHYVTVDHWTLDTAATSPFDCWFYDGGEPYPWKIAEGALARVEGGEIVAKETDPAEGLPPDLARVLRDPTITIQRDHEIRLADGRTLFEHLEEWRKAPSNTASADLPEASP